MQALSDWIKEIKNDSNISTLNEAQAKRSVIERILEFLDWDMYNYNEVKLEYGVETLWVDYALLINGENKVFIEAKRPSEKLETHQKQLLDYSFGEGVASAILTNGIAWWFYLPLKEGAWNDRKFYTIDILEQEIEDIVDKFSLLLSRQNVASGEAVRQAESILKSRQKEKIVKENLPKAWNKIIKNAVSPDSLLVDLLAETVEEVCGFQPAGDEILGFIRAHQENWLLSPELEQKVPPPINHSGPATDPSPDDSPKKPKRMQIGSESYELRHGLEILVNTANWLIDKGDLKPSDYPIKVVKGTRLKGSRYLINSIPKHTEHISGVDFRGGHKLKNGLFIETSHSNPQKIDYAKRLLALYKYDPEILKIDY